MARLLLDVGDEDLPGLCRAEPRDPLQLAALHSLRALQLLALLLQVSLTILERLPATVQVRTLDAQRLRLAQRPFLHPGDLLAPRPELVSRLAIAPVGSMGVVHLGR